MDPTHRNLGKVTVSVRIHLKSSQKGPRALQVTHACVQQIWSSPKMSIPGTERTTCSVDTCLADPESAENGSTRDKEC